VLLYRLGSVLVVSAILFPEFSLHLVLPSTCTRSVFLGTYPGLFFRRVRTAKIDFFGYTSRGIIGVTYDERRDRFAPLPMITAAIRSSRLPQVKT